MPRASLVKVSDTVVLAVGAFGSLASVALGAVVWSFNSREPVIYTRLDNLEKQSKNMEKQIEKLAFQLEMSTDRLAGDISACIERCHSESTVHTPWQHSSQARRGTAVRTSAMCRRSSSCLQGCQSLLVPGCSTFGSEVSADIALLSSCAQRVHGRERLEHFKRLSPPDTSRRRRGAHCYADMLSLF